MGQISFGAKNNEFLRKRAAQVYEEYQDFYKRIIAGNETWINVNDQETTD